MEHSNIPEKDQPEEIIYDSLLEVGGLSMWSNPYVIFFRETEVYHEFLELRKIVLFLRWSHVNKSLFIFI